MQTIYWNGRPFQATNEGRDHTGKWERVALSENGRVVARVLLPNGWLANQYSGKVRTSGSLFSHRE